MTLGKLTLRLTRSIYVTGPNQLFKVMPIVGARYKNFVGVTDGNGSEHVIPDHSPES